MNLRVVVDFYDGVSQLQLIATDGDPDILLIDQYDNNSCKNKLLIAVALPEIAAAASFIISASDYAHEELEEQDVNDSVDQNLPDLIDMIDDESDDA